jgi:hypothetical protein
MVIAVCRVAPADAIPGRDKDGRSGAGDENWLLWEKQKPFALRREQLSIPCKITHSADGHSEYHILHIPALTTRRK